MFLVSDDPREARRGHLRLMLWGRLADVLEGEAKQGGPIVGRVLDTCEDEAERDLVARELNAIAGWISSGTTSGIERQCCVLMMEACEEIAALLVGLGEASGESSTNEMFGGAAASLRELLQTMSGNLGIEKPVDAP